MLRNILIHGAILSVIMAGNLFYMVWLCYNDPNFHSNPVLGYFIMFAMFSVLFFGVRNYRKNHGGFITFGKALAIGALTALLACTVYVIVWLIMYYNFYPDFIDKYTQHALNEASRAGATAAELNQAMAEMSGFKEMYKSPFFVVIITYSEVLPLALLVALISALILRKNQKVNS